MTPDITTMWLCTTMTVEFVDGDLLKSDCYFIVQQTNCLTVSAHGLSQTIADTFPHANAYSERVRIGQRNLATKETRGLPGRIKIMQGIPNVVCISGQWRPGSLHTRYFNTYPESSPPETAETRLLWFRKGLKRLGLYLTKNNIKAKVGFPYKIGCGLAGGSWPVYLKAIERWAGKYEDHARCAIYKI